MKYPNLSGGNNMAVSGNGINGYRIVDSVDEVDTLFSGSCWQSSNSSLQSEFMDTHKLILDGSLNTDKLLLGSPIHQDENEIALDSLLLNQQVNASLAELKPLPPFAGYTANLSINGIQGHHYHAIAQRMPEDSNNNYNNYNEQNIVSSSTCNASADSAGESQTKPIYGEDDVVKLAYADCGNPDSVSSAKLYDDCSHSNADSVTHIKTEIAEYDISSIDDIAAIIGNAIADTTVPNNNPDTEENNGSRDSWMDLDAWIGTEVDQQKSLIITQDSLSEFVGISSHTNSDYANNNNTKNNQQIEYTPKVQATQGTSTLQSLLTHGYMPLLQNRLQNGPPIKQEMPSSTNYGNDLISTSSPPANVVSTTDNVMVTINGRFVPQYGVHSLADDRITSPDLLGGQNYPHTTSTTNITTKKSRSRAQKKQQQATSTVFQTEQTLGLLGKEKPVHRCHICNRGFLNKSNIKVHLRTHTGEKPFKCDTCAKSFRQKAHLLKHQQIHKRIGRD